MKNVLVTAGPIPAKLDSVKFVTNRFKGGLAVKAAEILSGTNNVTLVAWEHTELNTDLPIIRIKDVMDYYNTVLNEEHDAYVLSAAVANLMPSNPWKGKFPSHDYKVGDKFPIEFEIAPRVSDEIKRIHPRSTLIGYKLFDGTDEEIIKAGTITLHESKANVVFANHPSWAKTKKFVLTQDGAAFPCTFDEHCSLMNKVINADWFSTKIDHTLPVPILTDYDKHILQTYPTYEKDGRLYGTFAIRKPTPGFPNCFVTTTRGKSEAMSYTCVYSVHYIVNQVTSRDKATLNAPLLHSFLFHNPNINILIHGHELIGEKIHEGYEFPGTFQELVYSVKLNPGEEILLNHHGYIVGFETFDQYMNWRHKND